jgi:uncharacterized protein (DUF2267 family)
MNYDEFLSRIGRRASLDSGEAKQALEATLSTLAERISEGEAADLAGQLPPEAATELRSEQGHTKSGSAEAFDAREFVRRVGEREAQPVSQAQQHTQAVFQTLREAVTQQEFDNAMAQLPEDFNAITAAWRA